MAVGIALSTIPIRFVGLRIKLFVPDFDRSPSRKRVVAIARFL